MKTNARTRALAVCVCAAVLVLGSAMVGAAGPAARPVERLTRQSAVVDDELERGTSLPQTSVPVGEVSAGLRAFGFTLEPLEDMTQFNPDVWAVTQFQLLLTNSGDESDTYRLKVSNKTNPNWGFEVCLAGACYGDSTDIGLAAAEAETVGVEIFPVGQAGVGATDFTVTSLGNPGLTETVVVTLYAGYTTGVSVAPEETTNGVVLHQNTPNPARGSTRITFSLPREERVILRVYDVAGRAVRTLSRETYPAGLNGVLWDGRDDAGRRLASGVYLYQLITSREVIARQMVLVQ